MDFFAENQSFYRALFRATQAYSGGGETEPARENVGRFQVICARAIEVGVVDRTVNPDVLGESLMDVFAANLRVWRCSFVKEGAPTFRAQ